MIDNRIVQEPSKALLLTIQLPDQTEQETNLSLEELAALATTVGCKVIEQVVQSRPQYHPSTYIGKGKLSEVKAFIHQHEIDVVMINGSLTPKQGENLEKSIKCEVWDRTQLILEIFKNNAQTYEAKLQIELARLQYLLPRFVRLWSHLDRERGGIGTSRGMGEKQIETDRRVVNQRISSLKSEIKSIVKERNTQKRRRKNCLKVSLLGYTNAGKSTIMNGLTDAEVLVENKLFATLDSTTRLFDEKNRPKILMSDTVGFIKNLPHELVASFYTTLEVIRDADLLLHVVDINTAEESRPNNYKEHIDIALAVLDDLKANCIPRLLVFNKIDQVDDSARLLILRKKYPDAIFVSAECGNLDELKEKIVRFFEKKMKTIEICLDYQNTHNLAHVYELSRVDQIDYLDDGIHLTLTTSTGNLDRLRHQIGTTYFQETQL